MASISTKKSPQVQEVAPSFWKLCRNTALNRFGHVSGRHDAKTKERQNWDAMGYGSSMSAILVAGKNFKIFVKAHFHAKKSAAAFAAGRSNHQINDIYREYCNLIAGGIKQALIGQNLVCGISLPIIMSGYDELVFSDRWRDNRYIDCFDIVLDNFGFTVTLSLDFTSEDVISALNGCPEFVGQSEEIDFL